MRPKFIQIAVTLAQYMESFEDNKTPIKTSSSRKTPLGATRYNLQPIGDPRPANIRGRVGKEKLLHFERSWRIFQVKNLERTFREY